MANTIDKVEYRLKKASVQLPFIGASSQDAIVPYQFESSAYLAQDRQNFKRVTFNSHSLPADGSGSASVVTPDPDSTTGGTVTFTVSWTITAGSLNADGTRNYTYSFSVTGPYTVTALDLFLFSSTPWFFFTHSDLAISSSGSFVFPQAADMGIRLEFEFVSTGGHASADNCYISDPGVYTAGPARYFCQGYAFFYGSSYYWVMLGGAWLSASDGADYLNADATVLAKTGDCDGRYGTFNVQRIEARLWISGATAYSDVDYYAHTKYRPRDSSDPWTDGEYSGYVLVNGDGKAVTPWIILAPDLTNEQKFDHFNFVSEIVGPPGP